MKVPKLPPYDEVRTKSLPNDSYRAKEILSDTVSDKRRLWSPTKRALDQRNTGYCFGFSWGSFLTSTTKGDVDVSKDQGFKFGSALYHETIRRLNGGMPTHSGITTIGDWAKEHGYINEYRWPNDILELRDAVISVGPAVIAIPWSGPLMELGSDARLALHGHPSTIPQMGGHAVCIRGYDPKKTLKRVAGIRAYTGPAFMLRNSWGPNWGRNGDCWISMPDLDYLLNYSDPIEYNACIPVGRPKKLVVSEVFKNGEL